MKFHYVYIDKRLQSTATRENLFFASFLEVYSGICVQILRFRNKFLPSVLYYEGFRRFGGVLKGFRLCKVMDLVQKSTEMIENREMIPIRFRQPGVKCPEFP